MKKLTPFYIFLALAAVVAAAAFFFLKHSRKEKAPTPPPPAPVPTPTPQPTKTQAPVIIPGLPVKPLEAGPVAPKVLLPQGRVLPMPNASLKI